MSLQALSAVVLLWLVAAAPARADFIVSGTDQTVAVGGTADISFYITSASSDQLASFQLQLHITPVGAGQLEFNSSQPTSFVNDTNYVFYNSSLDANFSISFWGSPSLPYDTIAGGDTYYDNSGNTSAATVSSSPSLLAMVSVYANPNLVAAGESFRVALVPSSVGDPNSTYFADPNPNDPLINYTSSPVTVSVVPAEVSTVPAPPSVLLAGIGALLGVLYPLRRRMIAALPLTRAVEAV